MSRPRIPLLAAALLFAAGPLVAGSKTFTATHPAWQEECGSCHLAYPPELLPAASWQAMLSGLDRHFGSDASLPEARRKEIASFLTTHAGKRPATAADGKPLLRISETAWFRKEHRDGHDGLHPGVWKRPAVGSPANCGACHSAADRGDYSERNIRIPN